MGDAQKNKFPPTFPTLTQSSGEDRRNERLSQGRTSCAKCRRDAKDTFAIALLRVGLDMLANKQPQISVLRRLQVLFITQATKCAPQGDGILISDSGTLVDERFIPDM